MLQSFLDYAKSKNFSLEYWRDPKSYLVNWGEALHDQDSRKLDVQTLERTLVSRWSVTITPSPSTRTARIQVAAVGL